MTKARWIALVLVLLSGGISVLWGSAIGLTESGAPDFRAVYYGARCLIEYHNPYEVSELEGVYRADGAELPSDPIQRQVATVFIYLPTAYIFIVPFAMLPYGAAQAIWLILLAGFFILAALLAWNLGARFAPGVSLFLICILLANSEVLFAGGNTAGLVVSLCMVAVWCFLKDRFVPAGILCLAASLAIKPHDAGLVWLYFLLAGGVYRKRALQTLVLTIALGLPAILWTTHVAPDWMQGLQSNLSATSAHGGINGPGPSSIGSRRIDMVVDLQSIVSVFGDDPRVYNSVSYLVCGALLLVWSVRTLRSRFSERRAWLALAAIVPLTMLVTYHRPWDAKLLLLAVPACAMLWAEGGLTGWLALMVTAAGIVLTGDIPLTILAILTKSLRLSSVELTGRILTVVFMRPIPLILLVMSIFYLWVYLRRTGPDRESGTSRPFQQGGGLT
jgi:hypothetical protein